MRCAVIQFAPVIAWPWRLRHLGPDHHVRAGSCIHCGREVAVPVGICRPVCIYCGLDRGLVQPLDQP